MKFKRPDAIKELMTKAARHLPVATAAYRDLVVASPDDRPALLEKLHKIELESDEHYVSLLRKVTSTFVTPYDREDLYVMIETVDDVVDELDHIGGLIVGFQMGVMPKKVIKNAEKLVELSELCSGAPDLIKKHKKLEALLFEVARVENELDLGYQKVLVDALEPGADPIAALQLKTVADSMEFTATLLENFLHALAITAIKET